MTVPQNIPTEPVRAKQFDHYTQDALRLAMTAEPAEEVTTALVENWRIVRALLKKHGTLTTGDIATMTGRTQGNAGMYMNRMRSKGRVWKGRASTDVPLNVWTLRE